MELVANLQPDLITLVFREKAEVPLKLCSVDIHVQNEVCAM